MPTAAARNPPVDYPITQLPDYSILLPKVSLCLL